jgi:CrcB protein
MERFLLICLAGAAGSGARYLVGLGAAQRFGPGFPFGTLTVNLVGCFLIALVTQYALQNTGFSETLRLTLTTGFIGGLTTYSAFNYETSAMVEKGEWRLAMLYLFCTLAGCTLTGVLGLLLARRLGGA